MKKPMFYTAHQEGVYPTPREALAATGVAAARIEAALSAARGDAVLLDFGHYHALATPSPSGEGWVLWRAFIRDAVSTRAEAMMDIKQLPADLQRDTWAIFEYLPHAPAVH